MQLRKALTIGAVAVLTVGLSLAATATASTPTGGIPAHIRVNGTSTPAADIAIDGVQGGGTMTIAGSTSACPVVSASGTVHRGPVGTPDITFFNSGGLTNGFNVTCGSAVGSVNLSLQNSCSMDLTFRDSPTTKDPSPSGANAHDGTFDSSAYPIPAATKFNVLRGAATMPSAPTPGCVRISVAGGGACGGLTGVVPAYWDENIRTGGGVMYQGLIFDGPASIGNASGFCTFLGGTVRFNQFRFDVKVTGGTTTGIDFRLTP